MTLKELQEYLSAARKAGATDNTRVYLTSKPWKYMRDIGAVEFQKREGWPEKEWPIVISSKA